MSERFSLYYWPIPFRAEFIRYILAHAGARWDEPGSDAMMALYRAPVADQPVPFMAPPVLQDREGGVWLSQMPAICSYLGEVLDLMPGTPPLDALTRKVLGDCNDVIEEMTCNCGAAMWTDGGWAGFAESRLPRWLEIFEALGHRHGLAAESGTLLGTPAPGVADLACAALWVTIADKLPELRNLVARHAPNVVALSHRVAASPAVAALRAGQSARWGSAWCGGQIEDSLRSALANWSAGDSPRRSQR
jgi:glutathione S-transferase